MVYADGTSVMGDVDMDAVNNRLSNLANAVDMVVHDGPRIVAFVGQQGAGKSTLANGLVGYADYVKASFADALREDVKELYGLSEYHVRDGKNTPMPELHGATPRQILQRYGALRRRDDDEHWVNRLRDLIAEEYPDTKFVIDDLRYYNEAEMLEMLGARIVRLEPGLPPVHDNHESELDVPHIKHDMILRAVNFDECEWMIEFDNVTDAWSHAFNVEDVEINTVEVTADPSEPVERPGWDDVWFGVAQVLAQRATCTRAKVGAVAVSADNRMLVGGYNGAPAGLPHCIDVGCQVVNNHCVRTIHAEGNVISYAARAGISLEGASIYVSFEDMGSSFKVADTNKMEPLRTFPCNTCRGVLQATGADQVKVRAPGGTGVTTYYAD